MTRVVIVGGGITGLAAAWELQQQGVEYALLEASDRLGGKIFTERTPDGFVIEAAADSFITQKPYGWQLCQEIGLGDRMVGTNDQHRNVYVLHNGKLHPMPKGLRLIVPCDPDGILETSLLSEEAKQQMLDETEVPPRTETGDESLASFVRRRFGQEAVDVFADPLLAGIYTGNSETLSMQATFPQYLNMERTQGSLIRATKNATPPPPNPNAPKTMFVSLKSGMLELIEGLRAVLTGEIRLNVGINRIEANGTLHTTTGETLTPDAIILTIPASAASQLLKEVVPELAEGLGEIRTISSGTVTLGYRESELPAPLDGFGFVVTSNEPSHLRASTWSSTKLPGRAPEGFALLRVFVGGHRCEEDVALPDAELIALARTELKNIMGIEAEPVISRVFRWKDANTQYEVGHLERVARFKALCPPWLALTGSPYEGVGIPDCIRQGRETARQVSKAAVGAVLS